MFLCLRVDFSFHAVIPCDMACHHLRCGAWTRDCIAPRMQPTSNARTWNMPFIPGILLAWRGSDGDLFAWIGVLADRCSCFALLVLKQKTCLERWHFELIVWRIPKMFVRRGHHICLCSPTRSCVPVRTCNMPVVVSVKQILKKAVTVAVQAQTPTGLSGRRNAQPTAGDGGGDAPESFSIFLT